MTRRGQIDTLRGELRAVTATADVAGRPAVDLLASTFPEAQAYIRDTARLKSLFTTRRGAKSYSIGLEHVASALRFGGKHLILGLTRESVRGAFWDDVLKAIDRKHDLGLVPNETRLEIRTPNGGTIHLLGMDAHEDEKRKALGQKYRKVAVDESQSFKSDLEQLVFKTLGPATADLGGSITLAGTPGNITRGLFYEVTTGKRKGWSRHEWDTSANTSIPEGETIRMCDRWAEQIAQLVAQNPRVVEVPWFRQEYKKEWVIETDKLVYRYEAGRNDFTERPEGKWHFVLGCDLGYNDPTAWVVCAYRDNDPVLYLVEAFKESGLDVTAVAVRTRSLMRKYGPLGGFDAMVIDNANKQAVEEMRRRHDIPWRAADKTGKSDFIELMNGEYIMGNIKLAESAAPLAEEYAGLIWDDKAAKREEHPSCPNHCTDAALYAWRYCFAYLEQALPPKAPEGSVEWEAEEEAKLSARIQAELDEARTESEYLP